MSLVTSYTPFLYSPLLDLPICRSTISCISIEYNKEIIAYALIGRNDGEYELQHLFVKEQYRRRGMGKFLLEKVIETFPNFYLIVGKENHIAFKLYVRNNLKIVRQTSKDYLMVFCS